MSCDLRCDVAVIGSGAGGGPIAYHSARSGERTVLLERGKWVRPEDMSHDELEMIASIYKEGGAQTNTEADMFLLQGNCVGGSTVLTNAVCFRLPDDVRADFAARGFDLEAESLDASFARVESVMNVATLDTSLFNPGTSRIDAGMRALGLEPGRFQKCLLDCVGCGYCNVGCKYGSKMDSSTTWVPMAVEHGCKVVTQAEAIKVEQRRGKVDAILCRDLRDGSTFRLRAERFVLAGGAINTPELLLRSKIKRAVAGRRASFNAGAIMFAEFDEDFDAFRGDQMCVHHLDEGYAIEQIHNPPMSFALTMPGWYAQHYQQMRGYRRMTSAGVLVPTQSVGRVFLGLGHRLARPLFDHADVRFTLPESDLHNFRRGFKQLARIFLAGGARRVIPPLATFTEIRSEADLVLIDERLTEQKDILGFGSSHPQGGCSLGDDPTRDTVGPDYRVHGFANLFVCDASLFPRSIRVNPMLSIMAIADQAAQRVLGEKIDGPIREGLAWEAAQRRAAQA